jgi:hypothetical protein
VAIASSSSPHQGLSNDIKFIIFRHQLSFLPFFDLLLLKTQIGREEFAKEEGDELMFLWDPSAAKEVKERGSAIRVD